MSRRAKHVLLVLLAQAVALGVGLWMQQQFLGRAHAAASDESWRLLAKSAGEF